MNIEGFKKLNLPDTPGVYFFKKGSDILYIGKATSLKDRVRSYFSDDLIKTRGVLLVDMVSQADGIDTTSTDSVLEAFILETELIKKHQPRYNTKEKDNKSFNYVVFTKEEFPRVLVVRGRNLQLSNQSPLKQKELLGFEYTHVFGPYPYGAELREALKIIRRIFPYRDKCEPCTIPDTKVMKSDGSRIFGSKETCKPCFNRTIGLCPGVCTGEISSKTYQKTIDELALFFKGEKLKILSNLERDMKVAAKELRFEDASHIKKTIQALTHIHDISLIKKESEFGNATLRNEDVRIEAYDIAHTSGKDMVGTMVVIEAGEFNKKEYKIFNIQSVDSSNDTAALKEVLIRRFAHKEWDFPQTVVIDGGKAQLKVAKEVLDMTKGAEHIELVSVVKDDKHNAREILRVRGARDGSKNKEGRILEDLAVKINAECHRFSIQTHRKKRSKSMFGK